mmetsp:Transcript_9357/g.20526  ORF Transcript_9357/g.20526 Transcript_9357/m.20526 type:complete len:85 (+) Transcript_9357:83-337(+)
MLGAGTASVMDCRVGGWGNSDSWSSHLPGDPFPPFPPFTFPFTFPPIPARLLKLLFRLRVGEFPRMGEFDLEFDLEFGIEFDLE